MIDLCNCSVPDVRNFFRSLKKGTNIMLSSLGALGLIYFLYYSGIKSGNIDYNNTYYIFAPVADFMFPKDTSYELFRNTAFVLWGLGVPCIFLYKLLNKAESTIISVMKKFGEQTENSDSNKTYLDSLKDYETVNNYSICLSLDYEATRKLSENTIATLNKIIFAQIKTQLLELHPEITVSAGNVLIIRSNNFIGYDSLYDSVLNILSRTKKLLEPRYYLTIIPSLTTDAYNRNTDDDYIEKNHNKIKSFNFKNRALTSAMFAKKYKYLNKTKYAGIPIGEYAYFNQNKTDMYELNVVYKNLSNTLAGS